MNTSKTRIFVIIAVLFTSAVFDAGASPRFELRRGAFYGGGGMASSGRFETTPAAINGVNGDNATSARFQYTPFAPPGSVYQPLFMEPFVLDVNPNAQGEVALPIPAVVPADAQITLLARELFVNPVVPDVQLSATGISVIANPTEGNLVTVSATIQNAGTIPVGNFTVSFYAGDPNNGGVLIGVALVREPIPAGQSGSVHIQWDTTGFTGDIALHAQIDPFNRLAETNETNNTAFVPITVLTQVDLYITSDDISFSKISPMVGEEVKIEATVKNSGETDAISAVIEAYVGNPDVDGVLIGTDTINVLAGGSATVEITWTPDTAGALDIFVSVNGDGAISESDFSNNAASKSILVSSVAIYIDCGNETSGPESQRDQPYSAERGYGYLNGFSYIEWGVEPYQSVRYDGNGEIRYQFDNLSSDKHYHLDFSFYEGDGAGRTAEIYVDDVQEPIGSATLGNQPVYPSLSVLLSTYADDNSIVVSIKGIGGSDMVVSEIRLIPVQKIVIDCGTTDDIPYDDTEGYGYLNGVATTLGGDTIRQDMDGEVRYQFDNLDANREYQINCTFYDSTGARREEIWIDETNTGTSVDLTDKQIHKVSVDVPLIYYSDDNSIVVGIRKTSGIGAIISAIEWEEKTTLEPKPPDCLYGDVDGNGQVTAHDASLILQFIVGLNELPASQYPCTSEQIADVTGDGNVTALDAALILQYAVGLMTEFPAQASVTLSKMKTYREVVRQLYLVPVANVAGQYVVTLRLDEARRALAAEVELAYNPAIYALKSIQSAGEHDFLEYNSDNAGQIRLVWATTYAIGGPRNIATIAFEPANVASDVSTGVKLVTVQLNEDTIPVQPGQSSQQIPTLSSKEQATSTTTVLPEALLLARLSRILVNSATHRQLFAYSLNSTFQGKPVPKGAVIIVEDPQGVLCGLCVVEHAGQYGYMPIYGDDPATKLDEGAEEGDALTFFINGHQAFASGLDAPIWTSYATRLEIDLSTWVQKIPLQAGWNLVILDLIPHNPATKQVLAQLSGKCEVVQTAGGIPLTFATQLEQYSDLSALEAGRSYWLKLTEPATLTIAGSPPSFARNSDLATKTKAAERKACEKKPAESQGTAVNISQTWGMLKQILLADDSTQDSAPRVDLWGTVMVGSEPAPPGTVITVMDASGKPVGQSVVTTAGRYGFLHLKTGQEKSLDTLQVMIDGVHAVLLQQVPSSVEEGYRFRLDVQRP